LTLLIYIDEKVPLFIPSKDEIMVQKRQLLWLRRRGWCQWALIFCVDAHMELTPSAWVHLSLTPSVWTS